METWTFLPYGELELETLQPGASRSTDYDTATPNYHGSRKQNIESLLII
jgi:hypothetical protein